MVLLAGTAYARLSPTLNRVSALYDLLPRNVLKVFYLSTALACGKGGIKKSIYMNTVYSRRLEGSIMIKHRQSWASIVFLCTGDPYYVLYTALLIS